MPVINGLPDGEWHFVQLVNFHLHFTDGFGYHHAQNDKWLLDGQHPHPANVEQHQFTGSDAWIADGNPKLVYDTPQMSLDPGWTEATDSSQFRTWLMFRPRGDRGRWVPMNLVQWGYTVKAVRQPLADWSLDGAPTTTKGAFTTAAAHPEWQEVKPVGVDQWVPDA